MVVDQELVKNLVGTARSTLHCVFKWGCPKSESTNLEVYLKKEKGMSDARYDSIFNLAMRKKIIIDPKGETFDIPLLTEAIKVSCTDLAPYDDPVWDDESDTRLESIISSVRHFRNSAACVLRGRSPTNEQIKETVENLRKLLKKLIIEAGKVYDIDYDVVELRVYHINEKLDDVIDNI